MEKHKVFNPATKKASYHLPNWDWSTHTWDTNGDRKVWCKSNYCSESMVVGSVRILKDTVSI